MAKKVLSIEIGGWWTKVCLVDYRKSLPHVYQSFYFETPEHSVEDGYIRDKESFAASLKGELAKRRISEKAVMFSINSSKVVTREVLIPDVKDKEIAGIVEAQVREYFPMDVSDYTVSHKKIGTVDTPTGKQLKILLVAVPDNLLTNYCSFIRDNGFNLEAFEYIGNSAVTFINSHFQEPAMVVQLEEQATIISIVAGKQLLFQRIAPYGYGTSLSSVLDHPILGVEDERAAYHFLCTHDILHETPDSADFTSADGEDADQKQELIEEAYEDIRETLSYHIRVVYTALDYYKNQIKGEFQGKLYLIGDGAQFAGVAELFRAEIPLQMAQLDYGSMFHFSNQNAEKEAGEFGVAGLVSVIGAAVEPFGIEPKEVRQKADKKSNLQFAYGIFAAAVAISAVMILASSIRYFQAASRHDELTDKIKKMEYVEEIYKDNQVAQQNATGYFSFHDSTKTSNEAMGELIKELENELPPSVVVQSLTITENLVSINMTSDAKLTTAQMLINFKNISLLNNMVIPTMTETENAAGTTIWQYTLTADYAAPVVSTNLTEQMNEILGIDTESKTDAPKKATETIEDATEQ